MRAINAEKLPLGPKEANQFIPYEYASGWNDMLLNVLKAEQIDAVPVVRCKDCKNYGNINRYTGKMFDFNFCDKFGNVTKETDFCSYGERKEGSA